MDCSEALGQSARSSKPRSTAGGRASASLAPVKDQDRFVAEDGSQGSVGLARMEVGLISGQHLADRVGIGDVDASAEDGELDGVGVAVALAPADQGLKRTLTRWANGPY
jgi:hypothetical protein